jgi:UDP-glucose 4-epimerase
MYLWFYETAQPLDNIHTDLQPGTRMPLSTSTDLSLSFGTCMVLGAGGFIGMNLCRALLAQGVSVRAYDRNDMTAHLPEGIEWYVGEFADIETLRGALKGVDCVFHLISTTVPASAQQNPVADIRDNLLNTVQTLEICREVGVRKVIFLSSGGTVYGPQGKAPISESTSPAPISFYGTTKLAIETYLGTYARCFGLQATVLRLSNPYGPLQHSRSNQGVVSVFLNRIDNGLPLEIWGDGSVVRDYIYIDDVCDALLLSTRLNHGFEVLNIGGGDGLSLSDLITKIESATGKKASVNYLPGRGVDVPVNILDISKAHALMGWAPQTSMDKGLTKTLQWLRQS